MDSPSLEIIQQNDYCIGKNELYLVRLFVCLFLRVMYFWVFHHHHHRVFCTFHNHQQLTIVWIWTKRKEIWCVGERKRRREMRETKNKMISIITTIIIPEKMTKNKFLKFKKKIRIIFLKFGKKCFHTFHVYYLFVCLQLVKSMWFCFDFDDDKRWWIWMVRFHPYNHRWWWIFSKWMPDQSSYE